MMCFKIFISVFTIIFVVNLEIVQTELNVKNTYETPKFASSRTSINLNRTPYVVYLPQIKETLNHGNEKYFNELKTRTRPNNLKKIIPNVKSNFPADRILKTKFNKSNKKRTIHNGDYIKKTNFQLPSKRETQIEDDTSDDDETNDFTPTQLLLQTRQSSNKEHLPLQMEDPRLREVIKDTKVHIEYTEEGYEDIGYDHAGEERHEENNEGYKSKTSNPTKSRQNGQLQTDIEKEFNNYEKIHNEDINDENQSEYNNKSKRKTRFTNDIPNIQINDYLANIKKEPIEVLTTERYPYYKFKDDRIFNKNSALRYAEDVKNVPKKTAGDLSFYKHTGAFKCDEITLNINPLPNKTHGNTTSILPGPRLKNLGENILCLKSKYFGINPLDNPLFAEVDVEEPQPLYKTNRNKRSLESDTQLIKKNDLEEPLPESSPLRLRKRRRKYPVPLQRPLFRGDSYLPTPVPPLLIFSSTILPRYKTISEVYYKDEIQPNEQLNVFADVMNNIKKIQTDSVSADTEFVEDKYNIENHRNNIKIKVPVRKIKIRQSTVNSLPEVSTTTTTTEKLQTRRRNTFKNHKPDPQVFEEYVNTIKSIKEQGLTKDKKPLNVETNYNLDQLELEDVIGLSPPTIELSTPSVLHNPSSNNLLPQKILLNTFPVTGMKPPVIYRPIIYSGFINSKPNNRIRRKNNFHIIHKRSAPKPVYSEIRRNKPQQSDKLDDDYTPKRNRNYYYDIETKQVIYTKPEQEIEEEQMEKVIYEDATDKIPFEQNKFTESSSTTSTEAGPSFLDYVNQVKTHQQYQNIMEPTEKSKESTSTVTEQATLPVNSGTPDFLKIVSKLKQNDGYVVIPEKSKVEITTKSIQIEKNRDDSQELQIFDITEYLPKQESYVSSVTIDYSKYKTIERKPMNSISSKYTSEEDNIFTSNDRSPIRDGSAEQSTIPKVTTTTESGLTTTRKQRLRTRRPLVRKTSTSTEPTSTTIPSRNIRRRFRSTTQATTETSQETHNQTQRTIQRRLTTRSLRASQIVPSNHKEVYTPIEEIRSFPKHEQKLRVSSDILQNFNSDKDKQTETTDKFYPSTTSPHSIIDHPKEYNSSVITQTTDNKKENQQIVEEPNLKKIKIIKDPSKRSYYYVPVK